MAETRPVLADSGPPPLSEALAGRFVSLVHIMRGRWSLLSRLGLLELAGGTLTLRDGDGAVLFAVPVGTVVARRWRRRLALYQMFFQIRTGDRWWYLAARVPATHAGVRTRAFVRRYRPCDQAPLLSGMTVEAHGWFTRNPVRHQVLWSQCWLEALSRGGADSG